MDLKNQSQGSATVPFLLLFCAIASSNNCNCNCSSSGHPSSCCCRCRCHWPSRARAHSSSTLRLSTQRTRPPVVCSSHSLPPLKAPTTHNPPRSSLLQLSLRPFPLHLHCISPISIPSTIFSRPSSCFRPSSISLLESRSFLLCSS